MIIYNWEIGYMNYVLSPSPIVSPPFYIEPSRTFVFCLQLHPFVRDLRNYNTILMLWRCDSNGRNIELRYTLRLDSTDGTHGINSMKHETYTYNFITPMQFPESRVWLIKPVTGYESILRITCMITNHDIFQDVDEDVMSELSSEYESLLNDNIFSNYRIKIDNKDFYIHKAILGVRCNELARKLKNLERIDPAISRSILEFLYSGKLTTWTANIIPELMKFGSSLLKTMYPFLISDYSAKTSFLGNCYSFDWVIENLFYVRPETIFTYVIVEEDTIIQLSFFPYVENHPNFYIETIEHVGCFIRCRVDIQLRNEFITLVEMSNSETNPSLLKVNKFVVMNSIMCNSPHYAADGKIELKIYIHMCSFNSNYTSNVDSVSCTNVSNRTVHMYNLREDFKKLFYNPLYYDFEIVVNYMVSHVEYEKHNADYVRFNADNTNFVRFYVHKAILAARSSVFRSMFINDYSEARNNEVEINDINSYALHKMLLFMYCGQLSDLNMDLALELNSAADKYEIKMLVKKCSDFLESNIRADTVDTIQKHARRRNMQRLETACVQFRARNIT